MCNDDDDDDDDEESEFTDTSPSAGDHTDTLPSAGDHTNDDDTDTLVNENEIDNEGGDEEANFAEMDRDTAAVMKERVAVSSRIGYERRNITFMIWLFDKRATYADLLEPSLLEKMEAAYAHDRARRTKKGRPSKSRQSLRAVCREALRSIDQEVETTMPVKLEKLDFKVFARFLSTFKKTVKKRRVEGNVIVSESDVEIRLSPSSFDGACSALSHLYHECGLDKEKISKELWTKLSSYKKGTRRKSADERKSHGLAATDGKKPLPFKAYRLLSKILFESEDPEHVPAHTFLLLEWHLISRAEYVVDSKIDLVSFVGDAMLFEIGKTKTDQEGTKNIDHPWHVYANPIHPEICPMLGMARHLICNPTILNGQCDLFEGSSQYERFNKIFLDIVSSNEYRDKFVSLGMPPEYFGTHSIRKGAATFVATGSTSCPPIASICLRANWAMPGVLNRYIKFEYAGDQFVGKCVSGRPRKSTEFATSQAYFDFSSCSLEDKECNEEDLHNWIKERMPELARENEKVFCLFKHCIAALVHHEKFLEDHLHRNSMVKTSIFMTETIPMAEFVTTKYPWNATDETPDITGLPTDITLMAEIQSMKEMMKDMRSSMQADFKSTLTEELDARQVGGAGYAQSNVIMDKLNQLLERTNKVAARAEQDVDINFIDNDCSGFIDDEDDIVIRIDDDGIDAAVAATATTAIDGNNNNNNSQSLSAAVRDTIIRRKTNEQLKKRKLTIGYHHGRLNPLPSTWEFPKGCTVIQLINMWLLGDQKSNVPPLRMLAPEYVKHIDKKGRNYSKMKQVMLKVEHFAKEDGVWLESHKDWNGASVTTLWSKIWPKLDPYLRTESTQRNSSTEKSFSKSRQGQISWRTCYNKMQKKGLFVGNRKRKSN